MEILKPTFLFLVVNGIYASVNSIDTCNIESENPLYSLHENQFTI